MHNQTFQERFLPMQRLTGGTQIRIKSEKSVPKEGISANIELFSIFI